MRYLDSLSLDSLSLHAIPVALLLVALLGGGPGCGGSSSGGGASVPIPEPRALNVPGHAYGSVPAPVTSSVPHAVTVWAPAALIDYSTRPGGIHPSVRLTRSVLRPGEDNTPLQRLLEEVVLTRPEADSRISPHVAGPPPGWQVCRWADRVVLGTQHFTTTDQHGNTVPGVRLIEAEGLADCDRRVIWVRATDDATTAEGTPLMPALAHELLHAHVYEAARKRGATHDQAKRESKAIDTAPSP